MRRGTASSDQLCYYKQFARTSSETTVIAKVTAKVQLKQQTQPRPCISQNQHHQKSLLLAGLLGVNHVIAGFLPKRISRRHSRLFRGTLRSHSCSCSISSVDMRISTGESAQKHSVQSINLQDRCCAFITTTNQPLFTSPCMESSQKAGSRDARLKSRGCLSCIRMKVKAGESRPKPTDILSRFIVR
jgi:hypothetical protein